MTAPEFVWVAADGGVINTPPAFTPANHWTRYRLVPAPEPLRLEMECKWHGGPGYVRPIFDTYELSKFVGKNTRVTIEEIQE